METKNCQNCKQNFTIEPEDFVFYRKMQVPPPTFCPECRAVRRMVFWNQSNPFKKIEKRTGKAMFSTYPEEAPVEIYEKEYWWSDAWNPMDYGKDYDFSKTFFEQFKALSHAVPLPSRSVRGMENSDYSNQASNHKNTYLCFNGSEAENCLYCISFIQIQDCVDVYSLLTSQLCYEIYQGARNYQCFFCTDIEDSRNVWFSRDMANCSDCIGCFGLRNRQYCIFNEQYTKEEYEKKLSGLRLDSYSGITEVKRQLRALELTMPHKYIHGTGNVNVSGDYVYGSKNAHDVYEVAALENVRYSQNLARGTKDSYDYTNWGENSELIYEVISLGDSNRNVKFSFDCWPAMRDVEYSVGCHNSSNIFGCVGLRKKEYCILNKQYTKEEYEALVPRIKQHMDEMPYIDGRGLVYKYGEFFPAELSPLAYNQSVAGNYYPITKERALELGYLWRDPDPSEYTITVTAAQLPDSIGEVGDDILQALVECSECKRAYRILDRELVFLRRFGIPLPRFCVKCRYLARIGQRNPPNLYDRVCMCENHPAHFHGEGKCPNAFKTSYAPDRPEIVYCEQCYNAEVV